MSEATKIELTTRRTGRTSLVILVLAGVVVVLALLALTLGPYELPVGDTLSMLVHRVMGVHAADARAETVLFSIRAPRVLAALLLGAALAAAGAAYQGMFRNPLVSPDILGVSSGAGLGAVLGIFLSLPVAAIQFMAFAGGLAAVATVTLIAAAVRRHDSVLVLVLAGVVIGALAGAATSLLKILADPYDQLPAITFWLLGSLSGISLADVTGAAPVVLLGLAPLAALRWRINVLAMGDEEAKALGVEAGRMRLAVVLCATLVTAAVVSIAGVVGWVGLIVPHMARMLVGPGFGPLLPTSILLGASFMLAVDTLARTVAVMEVPLGILTAVLGAPVFLLLLARGRRAWT